VHLLTDPWIGCDIFEQKHRVGAAVLHRLSPWEWKLHCPFSRVVLFTDNSRKDAAQAY
jgi:hypothetical protein